MLFCQIFYISRSIWSCEGILVSTNTPQKPGRCVEETSPETCPKNAKSTLRLSPQLKAMLRGVFMMDDAMPYCLNIFAKA